MRSIIGLIATLVICAAPVASWAIEGFSGSMWGIGIYETTEDNPKTLGSIRQGIDWFKVYDTEFSTYGKFRYRFEDKEAEFFDAYGPALGVSLKRGNIRLGLEHRWERQPRRDKSTSSSDLYLEWYFGWDLKDLKK